MNINWKLKSFIFSVIDFFHIEWLLYFAQQNITKRSKISIDKVNDFWLTHKENLKSLKQPKIIEFGAGKILQQNLYLSHFVSSQYVVDLFPQIDIKLVNNAAMQISEFAPKLSDPSVANLEELYNKYNIKYIAPLDMRNTKFEDNEFDGCVSTNTLEHIPKEDIIEIFKELKRIIRSGGIISALIDYSDHYAHTDSNIDLLNYLKFSSAEFKKYNHRNHYQNRLRHYHYADIFKNLGYEIVEQECTNFGEPPNKISSEFNQNDPTVFATRGVFVLKN